MLEHRHVVILVNIYILTEDFIKQIERGGNDKNVSMDPFLFD